jgi:hypothetical protein
MWRFYGSSSVFTATFHSTAVACRRSLSSSNSNSIVVSRRASTFSPGTGGLNETRTHPSLQKRSIETMGMRLQLWQQV